MGNELPKGWKIQPLKDVVTSMKGKKPKLLSELPFDNSIPYIDIKALEKDLIEQYADIGSSKSFSPNDIAVVWDGARCGWVAKAKEGAIGSTICALTPLDIESNYLYYFLLSKYSLVNSKGRGVGIPHIDPTLFWNMEVPIPLPKEQKKIAEKLDKLFDQIESIKKSTERIPELLKNFRQQILTYAVTGKLTERWREGNDLNNEFALIKADKHRDYNYYVPASWALLSFSNVVTIESNLVNPSEYKDYPLIAPDNIESMTGRILSKPTVAEIAPISPKHYFNKGSLIYSKIRPYLSKIVYVDFDGLCSADMYPLKTKLNIFYLYYYMLSSEFLSFATTAGERIVLPKINQKSLNIIPIPVPSLKEQEEIVNRVQSLFSKLDIVEKRYATLCDILDKLPQAILNKAFKGKLL